MRTIVVALTLTLTSCATTPSTTDTNEDALERPWMELGTGLEAFEPLPEEDPTLELVQGPQGGWHVHLSLRMHGFAPVELRYVITRVRDERVVCLLPLVVRAGTFVDRGDVSERVGDFAIFDIDVPSEIVGEEVVVMATLYDEDEASIRDEVRARVLDAIE